MPSVRPRVDLSPTMTAMRVLAVALLSTLFLDGVSASAEARATALTPQQHEAALAKAATLRRRQSRATARRPRATVSFAAAAELRARRRPLGPRRSRRRARSS